MSAVIESPASRTSAIHHVTDESFQSDVLKSSLPVLVDYWAEWCGPCKMIAPMLEDIARTYADRVIVAKLNVDESPKTPSEYHVRGIPTLMLFKDGHPVATRVGALSKIQLSAFIEDNL
jgi:thioredoxin 1